MNRFSRVKIGLWNAKNKSTPFLNFDVLYFTAIFNHMAQNLGDKQVFSLFEVAKSIRKTLTKRYKAAYWVRAEMHKLNYYPQSGHCFPELLEKQNGKVIAQVKGLIWKQDYQRIARQFRVATQESLKEGIEVLMLAHITFDELHGLNLHIIDVDPNYTLGVLQLERAASIRHLKEAGVFGRNKQLDFPLLPKRIAVISVDTSKGLADFYQILQNNPWKYRFECTLFPALLQGEKSVTSIITQLRNIALEQTAFDVVAIIRGGGADIGLSSYNNETLAHEIACFPLPVLAGIGHATNQTVSELVAYQSAITPSALANALIEHYHQFSGVLDRAVQILKGHPLDLIRQQKSDLGQMLERYAMGNQYLLRHYKEQLNVIIQQLGYYAKSYIEKQRGMLDQLKDKSDLMDPMNALKRGFSIVSMNGEVIRHIGQLQPGAEISVQISDGTFTSTVKQIKEHE